MKRINLFGAPGAGKSVLAHELFVYFKKQGKNCEVVNELAREWAYIDRPIKSMDQVYLFSSQMNREDTLLTRNKAEFIITDSPIMLNAFYGIQVDPALKKAYFQFGDKFEQMYPSVNFFCQQNQNYVFHSEGRFHNQNQAKEINDNMIDYLTSYLGDKLIILENEDRMQQVLNFLSK
jgi:nicotinamide riboside kinase